MSNEEYIVDIKRRSAELEYEYWELKVSIAKKEKEFQDKIIHCFEDNYESLIKSVFDIKR